jgi:hypothetical protein
VVVVDGNGEVGASTGVTLVGASTGGTAPGQAGAPAGFSSISAQL